MDCFRRPPEEQQTQQIWRLDRSNNYLLHLAPRPIKNFFHRILNMFLSSPLPHHWLGSHICLLYKCGDPYQAANYRPIALLNTYRNLLPPSRVVTYSNKPLASP